MRFTVFVAAALLLSTLTSQLQASNNEGGLLIVIPASLESALKDYVKFRSRQMAVQVRTLEKIVKSTKGYDDPEKLKRFIYDQWKSSKLKYVLLVGDADIMPVRYVAGDRITEAAFDYAFFPSDLYYADLARQDQRFDDWNSNKQDYHAGYFGEINGEKHKNNRINYDDIDYRPEIGVGRWPVNSKTEIITIARKTVEFEKMISRKRSANSRKIALIATGDWIDSRGILDDLASGMAKGWTTERLYYKDKSRDDKTPPVNNNEVIKILNNGVNIMLHAGHGNDGTWDGCLSVADITKMNNKYYTPVMFSVGCYTARFATLPPYESYTDINGAEHAGTIAGEVFTTPPPPPAPYQTGKHNMTGLGEVMLRQGANGAVAYIGCNTGGQECALTFMQGFMHSFKASKNKRFGDCWKEAVEYYYEKENLGTLKPTDDWYPPAIFMQAMKFMVYGDPSLKMP